MEFRDYRNMPVQTDERKPKKHLTIGETRHDGLTVDKKKAPKRNRGGECFGAVKNPVGETGDEAVTQGGAMSNQRRSRRVSFQTNVLGKSSCSCFFRQMTAPPC